MSEAPCRTLDPAPYRPRVTPAASCEAAPGGRAGPGPYRAGRRSGRRALQDPAHVVRLSRMFRALGDPRAASSSTRSRSASCASGTWPARSAARRRRSSHQLRILRDLDIVRVRPRRQEPAYRLNEAGRSGSLLAARVPGVEVRARPDALVRPARALTGRRACSKPWSSRCGKGRGGGARAGIASGLPRGRAAAARWLASLAGAGLALRGLGRARRARPRGSRTTRRSSRACHARGRGVRAHVTVWMWAGRAGDERGDRLGLRRGAAGGARGVAVFGFVMVVRDGFETAVFLAAAEGFNSSGLPVWAARARGLALAPRLRRPVRARRAQGP